VWVGLGVGAAALLLCCLGGIAGFGGLIYTGMQAIDEQARATVGSYLDALEAEDFVEAYGLLCDQIQRQESVEAFTERVSDDPQVTSYRLGETDVAEDIVLPAELRYENGQERTLRFRLVDDGDTGELEICGVE